MRRLLFALIALIISSCTLGTAQDERGVSLNQTQAAIPLVTVVDLPTLTPSGGEIGGQPTPLLLPNGTVGCDHLRVDVGDDPANTLRLRESPNNNANIILLIPNNTVVTRVSGSVEIAAGGYNWINIQYTDPNGVQAVGWAARDAVKDRVTLRAESC